MIVRVKKILRIFFSFLGRPLIYLIGKKYLSCAFILA